MKQYFIYKITNPEGSIYIGCTVNYNRRIKQYKNKWVSVKDQKRLYASISEYGFEKHKSEVLENFYGTTLDAESKEMFWIRAYMCNHNKWPEQNGLNLTNGGKGAFGHIGALKGKKRPIQVCEKIAKGKLGIKATQSHKLNLSKSHIGLPANNRKAIIQFDLNNNFIAEHESIQAAANYINGSHSGVQRIVKGEYESYKGYKFKYK